MEFDVTKVRVIEDGLGGELYEPVPSDDLLAGKVKNIHVVTVAPGEARGNHYHPEQTESLCMGPGMALFTIEDGELKRYRFHDAQRVIVKIPPGVPHAIVNEGDRIEYVVCSSDLPHDRRNPDRIRKAVVKG